MREDGVLEIWAGTESPVYAQMTGSRIAGIEQQRVRVHVPDAGGSFGLHYSSGKNDPAAEAVQIAKALDRRYPIKVQSSREEEFKSGRYRAMAVHVVRAPVEGGLLSGLGAAAWGEIVLGDGGEIVTQNFDRYPVMRMQSIPKIEVHLIESTESPSGVGEVSVPTIAPALANAIFALTGIRIRRLPMSRTIQIY